ncbi:MGMT family protein [Persicitalea sp.]|uniref:MGMT family protein n=1 Tax=Persicitalea sp. TaxID=3100273 RepID=UPI003593BBC8
MAQSDFFENVYGVVRLVPAGRVTTYGAIAAYLGSKRGARMVGWAMNNAHGRPDVPAQRVVNRNGVLTGKNFFGSSTQMQDLLESEGVKIKDDQVVVFQEYFWDPGIELL